MDLSMVGQNHFFSPSGFALLFSVCRSHESITKEEAFFKTPFLLWLSTVVIHWSANGKTSAEIAIILNKLNISGSLNCSGDPSFIHKKSSDKGIHALVSWLHQTYSDDQFMLPIDIILIL